MNYYVRINNEKNIFLTQIFEPEENLLVFELTMGKLGELENFTDESGINLGPSRPIYYDDTCESFRVTFEQYIAYSVINESYEMLEGSEYVGEKIRIYKKSNFLDYTKADTFASLAYPGKFKHFAFITQNHIVNVVSTIEPEIEEI